MPINNQDITDNSLQGRPLMASYASTMANMLGTEQNDQDGRNSLYERTNEVRIEPTPQRFRLLPEGMDMTPEEAAAELGKAPFAAQREAQVQKFLDKSSFDRRPGTSADASATVSEPVSSAIATEPARWTYRIRHDSNIAHRAPKAAKATVPKSYQLRQRDGSLLQLRTPVRKNTDLKWRAT